MTCHTMIWCFKAWREQQDINTSCSLIKHWWLCLQFYFKWKCLLNICCNNKLTTKKFCLFSQLVQDMPMNSVQVYQFLWWFCCVSLKGLATKIWLYIHRSSVSCIYQGTRYCVFSLPTKSSSSSTQNRNVTWVNLFLKAKSSLGLPCLHFEILSSLLHKFVFNLYK